MGNKTLNFTVSIDVAEGSAPYEVAQLIARTMRDGLPNHKVDVWHGKASEHADVRTFHRKFAVPMSEQPSFLDQEGYDFRVKFMQEELDEFQKAHVAGDMHNAADALVDLAYVTHGTAAMMGLPWFLIWQEVQAKNMLKERAKHSGQSKRGSSLDVIKPPGWTPPNHALALGNGPWPVGAKKGPKS